MNPELVSSITIFVLALLVGFEVISKIPTTLHTPMMSGANSIHGVIVVGAMLVGGLSDNPLAYVLVFFAAAMAAMNVMGGYVVTDRMLEMFKKRPEPAGGPGAGDESKKAGR
jgi:NAD(P) transhydrogenase subunit alpha